jgi:hypothetical protein
MIRKMLLAVVAMGSSCLCANDSKIEEKAGLVVSAPFNNTSTYVNEGIKKEISSSVKTMFSTNPGLQTVEVSFDPMEFSASVYKGVYEYGIKLSNPGQGWGMTSDPFADEILGNEQVGDLSLSNNNSGRECIIFTYRWRKPSVGMQDLQEKFNDIKEDLFGTRILKSMTANLFDDCAWFNFEDVEGDTSTCGTVLVYPMKKYIIGVVVKDPKRNGNELFDGTRKESDIYPSLLKDCELIRASITPVVDPDAADLSN